MKKPLTGILIAVTLAAASSVFGITAQDVSSSRSFVGSGINSNNFAVFIFLGDRVIFRGLGPSLASYLPPGTQILSDPILSVINANGTLVKTQHSWTEETTAHKSILSQVGLTPTNNNECAIVIDSASVQGDWTAILSGENGSTGIGLVDCYVTN